MKLHDTDWNVPSARAMAEHHGVRSVGYLQAFRHAVSVGPPPVLSGPVRSHTDWLAEQAYEHAKLAAHYARDRRKR